MRENILCSACLIGIRCRYDGNSCKSESVLKLLRDVILIPVCPEQLGGLKTPREPCEIRKGKVVTKSGMDVTENFLKGAREVLYIAQLFGVKRAILKQYSPSCGCGKIYDGSFKGKIVSGDGITTKLLKKKGIVVFSDENFFKSLGT